MKRNDWIFTALTLAFLLLVGLMYWKQSHPDPAKPYEIFTQIPAQDPTPALEWVDINTASQQELETLDGIGQVLARRIIAYRQQHGPYTCEEDLLQVEGIGESLLEKIRDDIIWKTEEADENSGS